MANCRWWGQPQCTFCRQGEDYGMGPCHDRRTRELLDARGIWWPSAHVTAEPQDSRDWKRRQRVDAHWREVYAPWRDAEEQEDRAMQKRMERRA